MNTLNTILRDAAISHGLCSQWQSRWSRNLSKEELIRMFKEGQDFCILHDYPALADIRSLFSNEELEKEGIYLDTTSGPHEDMATAALGKGTYIMLGKCSGMFLIPRWQAVTIYARHDSHITIKAQDHARVHVRLYDNAEVSAHFLTDATASIHIFDRRKARSTPQK